MADRPRRALRQKNGPVDYTGKGDSAGTPAWLRSTKGWVEPAPKKAKAKAKAPKKPAAPKPAPAAAPAPGQVPGIHVIKVAKRPSPARPPAGGRVLKRSKKAAGGPASKPQPTRAAAAPKPQKKAPPPPPEAGESDEETADERPSRASGEVLAKGTRSPSAARADLPPPPQAPREAPRGPAERPGPGPGDLRLELQSPSKPYGQAPPAPAFTAFGRAPPAPPPGPAQDTSGFYELRAQYRELEQKYKDLKNAKISHVKAILNEQSDNIAKHSEASAKLAHVWREEAERQAALGELQSGRLQELEREVGRLREEHGREKEELRQRVEQSKQGSASLDYLTGFTAEAIAGSEGFTYTHPDSGFKFMLRPAAEVFQDDDGDLENEDLGYVPVEFGALEKGLLPGYLADEITIPGRQRARLFSIMFAKLTDPKARDAVGGGARV